MSPSLKISTSVGKHIKVSVRVNLIFCRILRGLKTIPNTQFKGGSASCIIIISRRFHWKRLSHKSIIAKLPDNWHSHKGPKDTAGHSIIAAISAQRCAITQMTQQMQQRESFHYDFARTIVWTCTSIALLLLSRLSFALAGEKQRRVMQATQARLYEDASHVAIKWFPTVCLRCLSTR